MVATTVLAPVASGLLTTISLDESIAKALCLLGFLGIATGLGIQTPVLALQTMMKPEDLPIGIAMLAFGATMGECCLDRRVCSIVPEPARQRNSSP